MTPQTAAVVARLPLTPNEATMLGMLLANADGVPDVDLAEGLWGGYDEGRRSNLRVLASRLRQKLADTKYVLDHRNRSYRLRGSETGCPMCGHDLLNPERETERQARTRNQPCSFVPWDADVG